MASSAKNSIVSAPRVLRVDANYTCNGETTQPKSVQYMDVTKRSFHAKLTSLSLFGPDYSVDDNSHRNGWCRWCLTMHVLRYFHPPSLYGGWKWVECWPRVCWLMHCRFAPNQGRTSLCCLYVAVCGSSFAVLTGVLMCVSYMGELTVWIVFPTVAVRMYRSSPWVPLDSCLTAAACLSESLVHVSACSFAVSQASDLALLVGYVA